MNYFCGSINPNGEWNIFDFEVGQVDSFYAHLKMAPKDIIVLIVGKQNPEIESGAYTIMECVSDLYKVDEDGKLRNRIDAKCIYHSGQRPFLLRNELEKYVHFPIRVPVQVKRNINEFSETIDRYL